MKTSFNIVFVAMTSATLAQAGTTDLLVSNLGMSGDANSSTLSIDPQYNTVHASRFVTGSDMSVVMSATAALRNVSGYGDATYEMYLYEDVGTEPGSLVATFDSTPTLADGAGTVHVSFTSTLGISLDANSSYWIGVKNTTGTYTGWELTSSDAESSPLGWTIDDDALFKQHPSSMNWIDISILYDGGVPKYSINGNTVPAPSAFALLAACGAVTSRRRRV